MDVNKAAQSQAGGSHQQLSDPQQASREFAEGLVKTVMDGIVFMFAAYGWSSCLT